jgi:hypothetical protein
MGLIPYLVEEVKKHANAHYAEGGWDVIVEAWSDSEIADHLVEEKAKTIVDALAAFEPMVRVWRERDADAENSRF